MNMIQKEVRELISVNERIQSALAQGHQLTEDEKGLVVMCACALITCVFKTESFSSAGASRLVTALNSRTSGGNVKYHTLVKDRWCWWYRKYAPGNVTLEQLEAEARDTGRGLWADPQPVPPWGWRKRK
jgi:hypothetical protein